jgi:hypothetical protein
MKKNNNNASDKSAIKSSLRTEINKITESEGNFDKLTCFKFLAYGLDHGKIQRCSDETQYAICV